MGLQVSYILDTEVSQLSELPRVHARGSSLNYRTSERAKLDIIDYIEVFYNCNRRHSYLEYLSPKIFEEIPLAKMVA